MQRVSSFLPSWEARRRSNASTTSNGRSSIVTASSVKSPLEKVFRWSSKPPAPLTTAALASTTSRIGREAFWPATLDAECDRSARILKSFCSVPDGFLAPLDDLSNTIDANAEPKTPARVFKKIPSRIIQNAAGIAIFTCMRSGLWMTGSGGSGILIARKADGTWSPPSGIILHTPSLSFIMGIDIYDCVLVINNIAALESLITKPTVTLGEDIGLTAGPLVALESTETENRWKDLDNTVLTYMKARGQTQNVNLNGCILTERANENEKFYGTNVTAMDIAAGNVSRHVDETRPLFEVIKEAEGRIDADQAILKKLSALPAPGDAMIETPRSSRSSPASPKTPFGIPLADDPDPYGVLALEMAGLEIREAGTRLRPTSNQFEFHPAPSSPAFSRFRQSGETFTTKSNRGSLMSTKTSRTKMSEAWTQSNPTGTPYTSPSQSQSQSEDGASVNSLPVLKEPEEPEEVDYTKIDFTPLRQISGSHSIEGTVVTDSDDHLRTDASTMDDTATKASSVYTKDDASVTTKQDDDKVDVQNVEQDGDADDEDDDVDDDDEEPVIFEVAAVQPAARTAVLAAPIHAKGALVTIPKRIPPPLPARSPMRTSHASKSDIGDVSHLHSPLQSSFTPSPRQSIDSSSVRSTSDKIPSITETAPAMSDVEKLENTDSGVTEKFQANDVSDSKTHAAQELEQATPMAPGAFPDEEEFMTPLDIPLREEAASIDSGRMAPKAVDAV
ncbi:LAS seventeen-binding protein [Colletotrichum higginsianum IMI 349063]|uniref:LAS seventeen-binding protein n=1 Tax=Colletotrichum higginsianum (strain IMI 349063) TaxID=759273 RepID=A0A1B7YK38_COLHI|nr:LAS seventeen-binding protein [Colletotrichum higginsianum IMI 349063]OBR12284.1 LAS seventeen-binding protein [Colletotrichum higginsianum IMI 349063]